VSDKTAKFTVSKIMGFVVTFRGREHLDRLKYFIANCELHQTLRSNDVIEIRHGYNVEMYRDMR
jgi:hypothetical protein